MASFGTAWAITTDSIRNKQQETGILGQAQLFWDLDLHFCEIFPHNNPPKAPLSSDSPGSNGCQLFITV